MVPRTLTAASVAVSVSGSRARTRRMPLVSTLKVTSIFTSPRRPARSPCSVSSPRAAFSSKRRDSPWQTWMMTLVCLSDEVANTRVCSTGRGTLRSTIGSAKPPATAMPSARGVTSSSTGRCPSPPTSPVRLAACTAAPQATTSSGLMSVRAGRPNWRSTSLRTKGMRVDPPTMITSSICERVSWAALSTSSQACDGARHQRRDGHLELLARDVEGEQRGGSPLSSLPTFSSPLHLGLPATGGA